MARILRPGLLDGLTVLLEGLEKPSELQSGLRGLGATVEPLPAEGMPGPADGLVLDFSGWTAAEDSGVRPLQELLDRAWSATEAVANGIFIPGGKGGRILFIAPAGRGSVAGSAAVAALENLSRTLSVEWARHSITTVTLAPAADTAPESLASVAAYLLSPAGAYFSGTRLELDSLSH